MGEVTLRALTAADAEYLNKQSDTNGFSFASGSFASGSFAALPDPAQTGFFDRDPGRIRLAVFLDTRLVGEIFFIPVAGKKRTLMITLGILSPEDRGRGIGGEALRLALTYAFASLGMEQVTADTFNSNPAALRVLEKAGFRLMGSEPAPGAPPGVRRLHYLITPDALPFLGKS